MGCEEYSGVMLDAALGALPAARATELRAHVSQCAACASGWEAARALVAAVDGGVARIVAGEPSPQFVPRLRALLAAEAPPAVWSWLGWRASLGLVAAAAAAAFLLLRTPQRVTHSPGASAPALVAQSPDSSVRTAPVTAPPAIARSHGITAPVVVRSPFDQPEVLVPRGQLALALLLENAITRRQVDGGQLSALDQRTAAYLELKAIEIAPLEVRALGGGADTRAPEPIEQGRQ